MPPVLEEAMRAPKRRKDSTTLALRLARAKLRVMRDYSQRGSGVQPTAAGQFIQCWAVNRGYSSVTQALDSSGQVWERVSLMEDVQVDGAKKKVLKDSWWEPLSMQRRALKEQL